MFNPTISLVEYYPYSVEYGKIIGIPMYQSSLACTKRMIKRSLRERLFTLPWKPFSKTKEIFEPALFPINDKTGKLKAFFAHPEIVQQIRAIRDHFKKEN